MVAERIQLYGITLSFVLLLVATAAAGRRSRDRRLAFVLPLAHLLICIVVQFADWAWLPVFVIEFPLGIVLLVLGWRYNLPPLLLCGVLGSAWWYLLSRALLSRLRNQN